jgi:hypothetical protein
VEGAMLLSALPLVMATRQCVSVPPSKTPSKPHSARCMHGPLVYARTLTGMSPETSKADRRIFIHACVASHPCPLATSRSMAFTDRPLCTYPS